MQRLILFLVFLLFFFLNSCQPQKPEDQIKPAVEKYLYVWNGGNLDSLDSILSENFEFRINPAFEAIVGREKLKEHITMSRNAFADFNVSEKDIILLGDTALVATWIISGTYNNPENPLASGKKTSSPGFSIIFFNDNKLTGEWVAYSDLSWYKGLGYELVIPQK